MPEQDPKIKELEDRLDRLVRTQIDFQKEITAIRGELVRLHARRVADGQERAHQSFYVPDRPGVTPAEPATPKPPPSPVTPPRPPALPMTSTESGPSPRPAERPPVRPRPAADTDYVLPKRTPYEPDPVLSSSTVSGDAFSRFVDQYTANARANLEEFVGKNLISLIGIVVLILGVGIGAKYAIDNNLISPLTRIIIGYVFGFGLVGLAIKLKKEYLNFSAVLLSGGMAIMYFVTYFAYSSYELISQLAAFGLMVMFTIFTVAAALLYSRQVIAHIGLVGAYAVPFLLSNDSGNYLVLFIYMAVINTGILAVSVKKGWTPIFYTASVFTWLIFAGWFFTKYDPQLHFQLALIFVGVFFAILYGTKVAQSTLRNEGEDNNEALVASTATAAIFYGLCYGIAIRGPFEQSTYWAFFAYLGIATIVITGVASRFFRHVLAIHAPSFMAWAILCGWFATGYSYQDYFTLTLTFVSVFFTISYVTSLLATRLFEDETSRSANLVAAILSAVILYGFTLVITTDPLVESPRYWTLFSYLAVASTVILATSFKFFGRALMYVAIPLTWVVYGAWFVTRYDATQHFDLGVVFAALFFGIFYFSILCHRLVGDNLTLVEHTSLVLSNSFVFYGFGYGLLDSQESLSKYLGLYTFANGVLHLVVALGIRALNPKAIDVIQVLTVLVLTFGSIAVPVQFDGNLVTMIWAVEGAILFWYGRTRVVPLFEKFSYPVMALATASLGLEWVAAYLNRNPVTPFVNSDFITAVV
ncbi:MAG TPA: DUF2339 domain-containing protein, partial [Pyrinomonadaceae bacterium]|nr:DUF2339 domain-containing protein [Pyrinomonadaceae bacterium]